MRLPILASTLRVLLVLWIASTCTLSVAQAGRWDRSDDRRRHERDHDLRPEREAERRHARRPNGGIPAVLHELRAIRRQLDENAAEMDRLRSKVETLESNTTPCTPERFRDGECGPENHPLDLMVSVCGNVGAGAGIDLKYAFSSNLGVQAGIGWKDAPDVHIVENAQFPAIIAPAGIPIVLPSELAGKADASVGLGLDGCLAPIRIPVGDQIERSDVLAILDGLEAQAEPIVRRLTDRLNGAGGGSAASRVAAASGPGMGLAGLRDALVAADALRDREIVDENPMASFGRGPIGNLGAALPIGERVTSLLDDPEQLALPGLRDGSTGELSATTEAGVDPNRILLNVCIDSPALANSLAPLCDFIEARIPTVDRVLDLIPTIELIEGVANDAVDGVRELIEPLLSDVGEAASNTQSRFCSSNVGQRRIFDRLCGR